MSEELPLFNSDLASVDDPSSQGTPVESSGVSCSSSPSSQSPALPRPRVAHAPPTTFECPNCGKVYVRRFYYDRHMIAHDMAGADAHMPSVQQFHIVMEDLMRTVLSIVNEEHELSEDAIIKKEFLREVFKSRLTDSLWLKFQSELSRPLLQCLTQPSKLLPQNKYEEALKKLNFYLGNSDNMSTLVELLLQVAPDSLQLPHHTARRLIFRLGSLLLDEIQIFIAKEMQSRTISGNVSDPPMSAEEKNEFNGTLGSLLRSLYRKGYEKNRNSKMFSLLCKCLKENFAHRNDGDPITSQQFMNKVLWICEFEDDENISISIDSKALSFFLFVEQSIKPKDDVLCSLDDVMQKIYSSIEALQIWYSLTNSYFGDENSVYVMKIMVSAFRELSMKLEVECQNRSKKVKNTVALRTGLKTN